MTSRTEESKYTPKPFSAIRKTESKLLESFGTYSTSLKVEGCPGEE